MTHLTIPIEKYGSATHLQLRENSSSNPKPGEVSISVHYSGINFADIQMRLGFYPDAPPKPFVPGYEVSGTIKAVGEGVENLSIGEEVMAGTYFGGSASQVTLPAEQVFPLPSTTTLAEGAAIPVNFITAHMALCEMARTRRGDRVLVECATGGVGTIAIQMARHLGADVVGLTTSPHKLPYIEALGAKAYTQEDFLANETIGEFDMVLNASGGTAIKDQMKRLKYSGRIVCIGLNSGVKDGKRNLFRLASAAVKTPRIGVLSLFDQNVGVYGLNALHIMEDPSWVQRLTAAFSNIDEMGLVPHVDRVFPARDVAEAHAYLQTKQAVGKVLLAWEESFEKKSMVH